MNSVDKSLKRNISDKSPEGKFTLSIIVPVYNERDTWRETFERLRAVDLGGVGKQIIFVDDCSTDGTREQLLELSKQQGDVIVKFHERNRGKGAAIRTGLSTASGDFVVIQDADLEYDPADFPALLEPLLAGEADVVYGSRFASRIGSRGRLINYLANRFLTWLSNLTTGLKLTDMETCYKMFRLSVLREIDLQEERFGFEPEVTAKVAGLGVRICERPIRYSPRSAKEGKKIGLLDGIEAIKCIFKYRPSRRRRAGMRD